MSVIHITLPDGSGRELDDGATGLDLAKSIGPRLAKAATGMKVNGEVASLTMPLDDGDSVEILTFDSDEGRRVFRHSAAHLMASAILRLRPETKFAIGPAIEDGFYYDIETEPPFTEEDFGAIEDEMRKIAKNDDPFTRIEVSKDEAVAYFEKQGDLYKVELLEDLEDGTITYYQHGDFVDLCRGPHLPSTGRLKAFKLLSVAGAYWRGDEKRQMLQRIYGTVFPKQKDLDEHLERLAEAEKRDHRKLGKHLDLFSFHLEGPGFPFFHPKGTIVLNKLLEFMREEKTKHGFDEIRTPTILERSMWERSGHWDHYKENMYFTQIDERDFAIKPMNCPGAMLVYKANLRSYRDLPLRLGEFGTVHRHEKSGVLHGLFRVRAFTQDDAHVFMMEDQILDEVGRLLDFVRDIYVSFGFDYVVELSTKPEKAIGSDAIWETSTTSLEQALEAKGVAFKLNPGDGAFYGPKIDFHVRDSLKRSWQCGTIQLDFSMPEKFDLQYTGADGERHQPVVIHLAIYGSVERFMAILIEHFGGAFPLWLAPVQAVVVPVAKAFNGYAEKVYKVLSAEGIRAEVDNSDETMKYKIRNAQTQKVPYMLIVGQREMDGDSVAVRNRKRGDEGSMTLENFVARLQKEIVSKSLDN